MTGAPKRKFKRKFFSTKYIPHERRANRIVVAIFLSSILVAIVMRATVMGSVAIEGLSMHPTLDNGDRFLFHRWPFWFAEPRRGDIVVVRDPLDAALEIKRVIALPGETVQVADGYVRLEGKILEERYLSSDVRTDSGESGTRPIRVPAGQFFVLGDNRPVSRDSRFFGPVKRRDVLGKIFHLSERLAADRA